MQLPLSIYVLSLCSLESSENFFPFSFMLFISIQLLLFACGTISIVSNFFLRSLIQLISLDIVETSLRVLPTAPGFPLPLNSPSFLKESLIDERLLGLIQLSKTQQLEKSTSPLMGGNLSWLIPCGKMLQGVFFLFLTYDLKSATFFFLKSSSMLRRVFLAYSYMFFFSLKELGLRGLTYFLNVDDSSDSRLAVGVMTSSRSGSILQGVKQLAFMIDFNYFICIKLLCNCIKKQCNYWTLILMRKTQVLQLSFFEEFASSIVKKLNNFMFDKIDLIKINSFSIIHIIVFCLFLPLSVDQYFNNLTTQIQYSKMLNGILWVVLLSFALITIGNSLHFVINLTPEDGPKCFFQYLTNHEKYYFLTSSRGHINYRMEVSRNREGNNWQPVLAKEADSAIEAASKMADRQGTYMFCVTNKGEQPIKMFIKLLAGLQMANLEYLPDNNDQQNLHKEIDWLQGQKQKLFDTLNRIDTVRTTADDLNAKMNTSYIVFAVLGLLGVLGVNFVFYTQTKKTLKERKLI